MRNNRTKFTFSGARTACTTPKAISQKLQEKFKGPKTYVSHVTYTITVTRLQVVTSRRIRASRLRKLSTSGRDPIDITLRWRIDAEIELFAILDITTQLVRPEVSYYLLAVGDVPASARLAWAALGAVG